jgi:hypothetical protein
VKLGTVSFIWPIKAAQVAVNQANAGRSRPEGIAAAATIAMPTLIHPALRMPAVGPTESTVITNSLHHHESQQRIDSMTINYSPNITVNGSSGTPEDWVKAARQHSDELVRVVQSRLYRQNREARRAERRLGLTSKSIRVVREAGYEMPATVALLERDHQMGRRAHW